MPGFAEDRVEFVDGIVGRFYPVAGLLEDLEQLLINLIAGAAGGILSEIGAHRMTRIYRRLTVATVKALAAKRTLGKHADGDGLYLVVTPTGTVSWSFRYMLNGRPREMGLGPLRDIGLSHARQLALQARGLKRQGADPIEARKAQRQGAAVVAAKAMSFRACARAYIQAHQSSWKNALHTRQWPASLERFVYPVFGDLPVGAIDVGLVLKAIEPIWTTTPETASRVRGRIEAVLDWAAARGYRSGDNPARWRGHLENLLPRRNKRRDVVHLAALPYSEIAPFMAELLQQADISARALEFAILAASRSGEVLGARWAEINVAERLWTIPGSRMKSGREHRVPLSDAALAIVEQMAAIRTNEFVFPGSKRPAIGGDAMRRMLKQLGRTDLTVHGFRSSFSDWCAEQTNFPAEVREMALAHAVGDKVEAAYRRGDLFEKRRRLAEAWAQYCSAPIVTGEIVPIRGRS